MRLEGWEKRLNDTIESARDKPFVWGTHDCALFAAECVQAVTGRDYAAPFFGQYDSVAGASALLDSHGGLEGIVAAAGFAEIPPAFATRGDLALVENDGRELLGVLELSGRFVAAPGAEGLLLLPLSQARKAWRVE